MSKSDYLYVGEDLKIRTGSEAELLIKNTRDMDYLDASRGIAKVPKERWRLAQAYERRTWMEASAHADSDRNEEHAAHFGGYEALRGRRFERAIELGCGPFTNLRVMSRVCAIAQCTLLDPLLDDYLQHRNCAYKSGVLQVGPSPLALALQRNWLSRGIRRVIRNVRPRALVAGVEIERKFALPIEEMPDCGDFDLVVMINVIEHCFDVQRIFAAIRKLCRPGAVFVFHDRLYDADEIQRDAAVRFDAGHPLRVDKDVVLSFLREEFRSLSETTVDMEDGVEGIDLTERAIYFIGEKS